MGEENRTLLLKIPTANYMFPPPEDLPTVNYIKPPPKTLPRARPASPEPPKLPPYLPPRNSPEKGEKKFCFEFNQQHITEKVMLGEYDALTEMVTDINGGHESKLVEKILNKQMRKLLISK